MNRPIYIQLSPGVVVPIICRKGAATTRVFEIYPQVVFFQRNGSEKKVLTIDAVKSHAEAALDDQVINNCLGKSLNLLAVKFWLQTT